MNWSSLRTPTIVCGVGFGGFFDGIVFHQLLQTHHLLSNSGNDRIGLEPRLTDTLAGLEANTVWDGVFHTATYLILLIGVVWLWVRWRRMPAVRPPNAVLAGGLLGGWGLFNLTDGIVSHHLLAIHHIVEGEHALWYDLAFLVSGVALLVAGLVIQRSEPHSRRSS